MDDYKQFKATGKWAPIPEDKMKVTALIYGTQTKQSHLETLSVSNETTKEILTTMLKRATQ
jgi:hypothetical protein